MFHEGIWTSTSPSTTHWQPRRDLQREAGGHLEAIAFFVLVHFGKVFHALGDDHVAGGAGAVSAAGMFEMDSKVEADVENRFGLSVLVIGQLSRFELDCLTVNRNLGHVPL